MRHSVFLVLLGAGHTLAASSSSPPPPAVLTQPLPTPIPISSYTFAPFPSPSSGPPIAGVYPLASPQNPPPVDNPELVPDFTGEWAKAYEKAKAKVSNLIYRNCFALEPAYAMHKLRGTVSSRRGVISYCGFVMRFISLSRDALRSPDSIFIQIWQ